MKQALSYQKIIKLRVIDHDPWAISNKKVKALIYLFIYTYLLDIYSTFITYK